MNCSISYEIKYYKVVFHFRGFKHKLIFYKEEEAIEWIRKTPDCKAELFRVEKAVIEEVRT